MSESQSPTMTVFLSSTIRDLAELRESVRQHIESWNERVSVRCLASENPAFPVTPRELAEDDAYTICLNNVIRSDFLVLIVGEEYGSADIPDAELGSVSITHKELLTALENRIPVFSFIKASVWERMIYMRANPQDGIPEPAVFRIIDSAVATNRKRWRFLYSTFDDIRQTLDEQLCELDDSIFVRDVTYMDNTPVRVGGRLEKVWEIRNAGMIPWRDRRLVVETPTEGGIRPEVDSIPIPFTRPGEIARLAVWLTAPAEPGTYRSTWKMRFPNGTYCFPTKKGIWVQLDVRERAHLP